jgi:anti-anti-sigma regulatory factor
MFISRERNGVLIFTASGELGPLEMGQLAVALEAGVRGGAGRVVLQMDSVEHVNYLCNNQFNRLDAVLKRYGAEMKIAGPTGYVRDILKFIKVDQLFRIHANIQQAMEAFGDPPAGRPVQQAAVRPAAVAVREVAVAKAAS